MTHSFPFPSRLLSNPTHLTTENHRHTDSRARRASPLLTIARAIAAPAPSWAAGLQGPLEAPPHRPRGLSASRERGALPPRSATLHSKLGAIARRALYYFYLGNGCLPRLGVPKLQEAHVLLVRQPVVRAQRPQVLGRVVRRHDSRPVGERIPTMALANRYGASAVPARNSARSIPGLPQEHRRTTAGPPQDHARTTQDHTGPCQDHPGP